jgi:serine/threonine-protein kinase
MSLSPDRRASWQSASPYLDTVLDLPPEERVRFIEGLRAGSPELAAHLEVWLAQCEALESEGFLDDTLGAAPPERLAGMRVGAYELLTPIGHGGMGSVWRARRVDGRYDADVAVTLLSVSLVGRAGEARFAQEGRILASLTHPGIARLIDAGATEVGQPYLVLEYVDGVPIDEYCDAHRLDVAARVRLCGEVLAAVAHAHASLVVHRDLKPSNVLVAADGHVTLLDFGIARLLDAAADATAPMTREGDAVLTPAYAAPEQVRKAPVTTATDVYALGVVLHVLLSGRHPAEPHLDSPAELLRAITEVDPPPMSSRVAHDGAHGSATALAEARGASPDRLRSQLRGDLDTIVATALKKAPAERYPSVTALADDLDRYLAREPVRARPDTLAYRMNRFVVRHRGAVVASTLALAAILAGLAGTIVQARRANAESARAQREAATARAERDSALEAQRIQRGTNEFLQIVMRDAATSAPGALRRQLDRTSELLRATEFEVPIVKVSLLRQTAGRYSEIGAWREGRALLLTAQESIVGTDLMTPGSGIPVSLACSAARYAYEMGDLAGARTELDAADRFLAGGAGVSVPSRVECRMYRGYVELAEGRAAAALATTEDAMRALEAAGTRTGEQHRIMRTAIARAQVAVGRTADARAIAAPLLAETEAGLGRRSMAAIRRSQLLAQALRAGGRPGEAWALTSLDEAALPVLLGEGRIDLAVAVERGRELLALGRFADAARALEPAIAADRASGGTLHLPAAELVAAEALVRAGQVARADTLLAASPTVRRGDALASRGEAADARRVSALLAMQRGDHLRAAQDVTAAQTIVDANGGASHPAAWAVAMARAETRLAAHDATAALVAVDTALAIAQARALDAAGSSDVGEALALRARIHAALGRTADRVADERAAATHLAGARQVPVQTTAGSAAVAGAPGR